MTAFHNGNSKAARLTPSQVQEIRARYAAGKVTQGQLAREYEITIVQIGRIVRREVWQKLPQPLTEEELQASAERLFRVQDAVSNKPALDKLTADLATVKARREAADNMVEELKDIPTDIKSKADYYLNRKGGKDDGPKQPT